MNKSADDETAGDYDNDAESRHYEDKDNDYAGDDCDDDGDSGYYAGDAD